ncbi:response regulator [Patescibacteria group bacterium]|nr:response regulator [Patescibacteria group bacterium]
MDTQSEQESTGGAETKKILIVEDDKSLRTLLTDILKKENFEVFNAEDGVQGIEIAKERNPDLILLDLEMPGIGGLTVLKKLRSDDRTKDISIIVLTNSADVENISEAMSGEVLTYLVKTDWELPDVVDKVKETLKMK